MSLRDEVENLLPGWESWYPSLFEAACDLGLLRARVCDLSSLLLSNRHAGIQNEALQSFKQQWLVEDDPLPENQGAGKNQPGAPPEKFTLKDFHRRR